MLTMCQTSPENYGKVTERPVLLSDITNFFCLLKKELLVLASLASWGRPTHPRRGL